MMGNVVTSMLKGVNNSFCCVCLISVNGNAFCLQDEIFVNFKRNTTEVIARILQYVLGNKHSHWASDDVICSSCLKSARDCYIFVKMCENNSMKLSHVIDALHDSFENTSNDFQECKSLFVEVQTEGSSVTQYYDTKRSVSSKATALTRFHSIVHGTYGKKSRKEIGPKEHRTRLHNYSEEMSKICDIIRESNHSKFKCKVCHGIFNKSFNFKKHYYSQHSPKQMKCSECGKCYGSEALLKQHKYDSHASITCSICGKSYTNRYSLLYHIRQHSGEQPYQCQYCDMKFQWSSRRAEHIRRYHLEPSVECDICHVMFKSLGSLYDHRKRHFNPNSRLHVMQQTPPVAEEEIVNTEYQVESVKD